MIRAGEGADALLDASFRNAREIVLADSRQAAELVSCLGQLGELEQVGERSARAALIDDTDGTLRAAGLLAQLTPADRARELVVEAVPLDARVSHVVAGPRVPFAEDADGAATLQHVVGGRLGLPSSGGLVQVGAACADWVEYELSCFGADLRLWVGEARAEKADSNQTASVRGVLLACSGGRWQALDRLESELAARLGIRRGRRGVFRLLLLQLGLLGDGGEGVLPLRGDQDAAPAAAALCSRLLAALRTLESGARAGLDDEYVHRMRVNIRRLRAALEAFSPCFERDDVKELGQSLKWLAGVLGGVRDLDVQLRDLPHWRARLGADPEQGWQELELALETRRAEARAQLRAAFAVDRYDALFSLGGRMFAASATRATGGGLTVADMARKTVRRRVRRFRRAAKACRRAEGAEAVHRLRISGKQLRYAAELFSALYRGPSYRRRLKRLAALQERLGEFQDGIVLGRLARLLAVDAMESDTVSPSYLFVLGELAGYGLHAAQAAEGHIRWALGTIGARREALRLAEIAAKTHK